MNGGTNDKFLRVKEIATLLRCSRQSLYAKVKRGMWPPVARSREGVAGMFESEFNRMQALVMGGGTKQQIHGLVELIKRERNARAQHVLDDMAKSQKDDGDI